MAYTIISILLFFLLYNGYFNWNKYQHVGNILAATAILSLSFSNKKQKWILFLFFMTLCILTGSRQSLVGVLFIGIFYLLLNKPKIVLLIILFLSFLVLKKDYIINKIIEIGNEYNFVTLQRFSAFTEEGGGSSVSVRVDIYNRLIDMLTYFPNFTFSPNIKELYPHNFFLEYSLSCGILIGVAFISFILYVVLRKIKANKKNVLFYFSLFYFFPFSISSGIAAAKYFLFFIILIIFLSETKALTNLDEG
jgi:hypothetical protein